MSDRHNVHTVHSNRCSPPQTLLPARSLSVLPFTCGDSTWFWLRQYAARCTTAFPSLPGSYKWSCDHLGQWSESGTLRKGAPNRFLKWTSIPLVYKFCYSTSSCLNCCMQRIQPVNTRQQPYIGNLHHELLDRKLEGAYITAGITESPIAVLSSLPPGILFHEKNKILSLESL